MLLFPLSNAYERQGQAVSNFSARLHKPIGISAYELTRALPENLKSSLSSVEEIEAELSQEIEE